MKGEVSWLLGMLCALSASATSAAATLHVPNDYPSIQQAIDASEDGDVVLVAAGTYFEQIDFTGHEIVVQSEDGPAMTTIDGTYLGSVVTFTNSTRNAVLQGFTITRGKGNFDAGGIRVRDGSASIIGNVVVGNLGQGSGNGVSLYGSDALIEDNEIIDNPDDQQISGGGGGGGIGIVGALCEMCRTEIRHNLIARNSVDNFTWGGGIYIDAADAVAIIGNVIEDNTAPRAGAGIFIAFAAAAQIENNLIVHIRCLIRMAKAAESTGCRFLLEV